MTEHVTVGGKEIEFEVLLFDSVIGVGNSDVLLEDGTFLELNGDQLPGPAPADAPTAAAQWAWLEGRMASSTADYLWVGAHVSIERSGVAHHHRETSWRTVRPLHQVPRPVPGGTVDLSGGV